MSTGIRTAAIAVLTAIGMLAATAASAQQLQQKRTFGLRGKGASHVQMRSVMAPVRPAPSSRGFVQTPVTVVLTVKDNAKVAQVCGLGPRITDALMREWWGHPMPLDYLYDPGKSDNKMLMNYYRTPEQKAEDARLIAVINEALGEDQVSEVLVIKGALNMGGGAISKLPFSSALGCSELEQAREKKKGGEHGGGHGGH